MRSPCERLPEQAHQLRVRQRIGQQRPHVAQARRLPRARPGAAPPLQSALFDDPEDLPDRRAGRAEAPSTSSGIGSRARAGRPGSSNTAPDRGRASRREVGEARRRRPRAASTGSSGDRRAASGLSPARAGAERRALHDRSRPPRRKAARPHSSARRARASPRPRRCARRRRAARRQCLVAATRNARGSEPITTTRASPSTRVRPTVRARAFLPPAQGPRRRPRGRRIAPAPPSTSANTAVPRAHQLGHRRDRGRVVGQRLLVGVGVGDEPDQRVGQFELAGRARPRLRQSAP